MHCGNRLGGVGDEETQLHHSFLLSILLHPLSLNQCVLVYTRAGCLNVTTRSFDARCMHNSRMSLSSSSPLFSHLLLFSNLLKALAIALYISYLSLGITCQPCLPGHLEREKAQWVVCHTPVDLSIAKGSLMGNK